MRNEIISKDVMWKATIRREMLLRRKELSKSQVETLSGQCAETILRLPILDRCHFVFLYASHQNEVDTKRLLGALIERGKKVACPKVTNPDKREMEFYRVFGENDLAVGFQGIWEPKAINQSPVVPERTVILVPGIAFNKEGARIGYGGGYYDHYLNQQKERELFTIALAYEFQIMEELPAEPYDVKVDGIVAGPEYYPCKETPSW